jgi:hypothetical protein
MSQLGQTLPFPQVRPMSASINSGHHISRLIAGCIRFLTLIQSLDRPA